MARNLDVTIDPSLSIPAFVGVDSQPISLTTPALTAYRGETLALAVTVAPGGTPGDLTGNAYQIGFKNPTDLAGDFLATAMSGGSREDLPNGIVGFDINLNTNELNAYLVPVGSQAYDPDRAMRVEIIDKTGGGELAIVAQGTANARRDVIRGSELGPVYANDLQHNIAAAAPPVATDDSASGYGRGSIWIYGPTIWICRDAAEGAAVWEELATQGLSTIDATGAIIPVNGLQIVLVDGSAGGVTVTLPSADAYAVQSLVLVPIAATAATIARAGSDTIESPANPGATSFSLALADGQAMLVSDGAGAWYRPAAAGAGDLTGPASATDSAFSQFDGTTGKLLKNGVPGGNASGNVVLRSGSNAIAADVIAEITAAAGVTIDGLLLKDGQMRPAKASNIASASTIDLTAAVGHLVHVTGTTTITAITSTSGTLYVVVFDGILTLTHHSTTLILPTGANITTAAGDVAVFAGDGSGNTRCVAYTRKDGTPLAGGGGGSKPDFVHTRQSGEFRYPAANSPPLAIVVGTYVEAPVHLFDDTTEEFVLDAFVVPSDPNTGGTVTLVAIVGPVTAAASKNVALKFYHSPVGSTESVDQAFTAVSSGDVSIVNLTNGTTRISWTVSYSTAAWAANDRVEVKWSRVTAGSGNLTGDMRLYSTQVIIPRT